MTQYVALTFKITHYKEYDALSVFSWRLELLSMVIVHFRYGEVTRILYVVFGSCIFFNKILFLLVYPG